LVWAAVSTNRKLNPIYSGAASDGKATNRLRRRLYIATTLEPLRRAAVTPSSKLLWRHWPNGDLDQGTSTVLSSRPRSLPRINLTEVLPDTHWFYHQFASSAVDEQAHGIYFEVRNYLVKNPALFHLLIRKSIRDYQFTMCIGILSDKKHVRPCDDHLDS